jgi:hypothetical protein
MFNLTSCLIHICHLIACPVLDNSINNINQGPLLADIFTVDSRSVTRLRCTEGYKPVGFLADENTVDCLTEKNFFPTCRKGMHFAHLHPGCLTQYSLNLDCPPLPKPANGMVNIFDDIATYVCDPGFKNLGTTRRRCVNGVWTGIQANCTKGKPANFCNFSISHNTINFL